MPVEETDRLSPGNETSVRVVSSVSPVHEPILAGDKIRQEDHMTSALAADMFVLVGVLMLFEPLHDGIGKFGRRPCLIIRT